MTNAAGAVNPGDTLREAREAQGLPLSVVSLQLNLSERALSQIEAGDFSSLPGHTFARGYVRAYAKLLGLDQARLVLEFDRYSGADASGSRVQALGRIDEPVRLSALGLRFFSFLLLVGLGVLGFLVWQDSRAPLPYEQSPAEMGHIEVEGADGTTQIHPLDEPEDMAVIDARVAPQAPMDPAVAMPDELGGSSLEGATAGAGEQAPAALDEAGEALAEPSAIAAEAAPVALPPAVEAPVVPTVTDAAGEDSSLASLELRFSAECWTRVTAADGTVLLNALVPSGMVRVLQGQPPFSVVLGFARGVEVIYNGNAVDLAPYRRGETARFQLGR
ncbi:helix-turn-helix domain-containing protein [Stutzerimonas tarimensis]